jgi:hypothetical protein
MKIIIKNSSMEFQQAATAEHIELVNTNLYLRRQNGTQTNPTTDAKNRISDFISLEGVTSIEVEGLKYGYVCCPYWYYTSAADDAGIADSCSIYNSQSEQSTDELTLTGVLSDKPNNANYIRFCSLKAVNAGSETPLYSISIIRED